MNGNEMANSNKEREMKDDAEERLKKFVSLAYWFISILRWILGIACMELN